MIEALHPPEPSMETKIMNQIHSAIVKRVDEIREQILADSAKQFKKELREIIGRVALNLASYYSCEMHQGNLVITVKIENLK